VVAPPDPNLKHKPFAALSRLVTAASVPAASAPAASRSAPGGLSAGPSSLGRVVVREEFDPIEKAVITRVIGLPREELSRLGKRWREVLGQLVLLEGRDLLVVGDEAERIAELLRAAGADEVAIVRPQAPAARPAAGKAVGAGEAGDLGEPGGTQRGQIRRGLRVAIVQKADQESGALTAGVVQELLTSSPTHPRGIKVRLESGEVGRVRRILSR
jgi:uncharacterized repeat protein (TIGR03833 family)